MDRNILARCLSTILAVIFYIVSCHQWNSWLALTEPSVSAELLLKTTIWG